MANCPPCVIANRITGALGPEPRRFSRASGLISLTGMRIAHRSGVVGRQDASSSKQRGRTRFEQIVVGNWAACGLEAQGRALALPSFVACAGVTKKSTAPDLRPWPRIMLDFRVDTLRMRLHDRIWQDFASYRAIGLPGGSVSSSVRIAVARAARFGVVCPTR